MISQQNQNIMFPKWISNKAIIIYGIALVIVTGMYFAHSMPWYYMLSGVVSVLVFFYYGNQLTRKWSPDRVRSEKRFEKKIFTTAFMLRVAWMFLIYFVFLNSYGDAFGFENADADFYDQLGEFSAERFRAGDFLIKKDIERWGGRVDISDMGYGYYVGLVYLLTNNSILAVRLLKCLWSAITVVLMYRLAKRNFGEDVGRMTAIFCMLWPNFWYYCGTHLKETEMVFLAVLFVEQADQMLRTRNFSAWKVVPVLLISAALFTIRTPLALVTVLCLLFSIVMSSTRVVGWGKRIIIGFLALALIGVTMGNAIQEQAKDLISQVQSGQQQHNMEWRTQREHGNKFAKYAGKAVFAPMIFTIPFPSMVRPFDGQDVQQLLNGGNFIKNILSFFTILVLFMLLFSGRWREHLVPLSYLLGYIVVLALSTFAQSERFHQPAMPMELMFAAYGIQQALMGVPIYKGIGSRAKYRQWFTYWMALMFVACIAWNWFKLAGRGLA